MNPPSPSHPLRPRGPGWVAASIAIAWVCLLGSDSTASGAVLLRDFDRDGIDERLISTPGSAEVQKWNPESGRWESAGYSLPEGVEAVDEHGGDAGLRWVDLNQDGFEDVLFSNPRRFGIHLWTTDVQPHLGWVRGWSQWVRAGERTGASGEPPSVVNLDLEIRAGSLVLRRRGPGRSRDVVGRYDLKSLIAFDMPPPLPPEAALESLRVPDGFRVELVAAEPVVMDPVAFDWDASGRMWVVEMRDYPSGMDGQGRPGGTVKILKDEDGDGRCESMTLFLEDLPFPTSVMPWGRGALVAMAPDLIFAEDTYGDGRADQRRVVLTGFAPGNQQHRFNGFEWGLDGWVHAANGDSGGEVHAPGRSEVLSIRGRDIRFKPDTGEVETVSAQTQYGRRRDDWGNWFGNNNPTWLWHVTIPEHYLRRNPSVAVKRVTHVLANYDNSTRVFPASPPMVRPNQPWSLNHVTSACSPSPYRDEWLGTEFGSSVFICEPVHNAIHREVLERVGSGFISRRANGEETREFLASTDNWFRPTTIRTGPDGALYVADMYRFVIEHPEWISPEMRARLDLRAGEDRGRIYRIVRADRARRPIPNLSRLDALGLVAALDSPNGWQRDMAQRLLGEKRAGRTPGVREGLSSMQSLAHAPAVRLQALATLGFLGVATVEHILTALRDPHVWVRVEALRQSESLAIDTPDRQSDLFKAIVARAADGDPAVRLQAAFSLGAWPPEASEPVLEELAAREDSDEAIRTAVLTSLRPERPLFARLNAATSRPVVVSAAASLQPSSTNRAAVIAAFADVDKLTGNPSSGRAYFTNLCAQCHRLRGEGNEVGADLGMVSTKPTDWLLLAILDPSQAVDARYQAWSLRLRSGDELDGLVAAETANNLVVRMAGGLEHAVLRGDIESMEPLRTSLMPDGFESALTPQGMADLLRWLRAP